MHKVIALTKQRLPLRLRQRIGKTISKIKLRWMPATSSKVAKGFAGDGRLLGGDRLNDDIRFVKEVVDSPPGRRVTAGLNHHANLEIVGSGDAEQRVTFRCLSEDPGIWLAAQNSDNRR